MNFDMPGPKNRTTDAMLAVYSNHPLSAKAITDRLTRAMPYREDVTEFDLAIDPIGEITDQNHIGGAHSTLRLAARANISGNDSILDLGCGIGGPARLLASVYGCSVHGVDLNQQRISDAIALAAFVNLTKLVTFSCEDIASCAFQPKYTAVWGQNSWLHVEHHKTIASIAASALLPDGRLAFEDVCLVRDPINSSEVNLLAELSQSWHCNLRSIDTWAATFEAAGLAVTFMEEERELFIAHLGKFEALAVSSGGRWPQTEIVGFNRAHSLATAGVVGYFRLIANAPPENRSRQGV